MKHRNKLWIGLGAALGLVAVLAVAFFVYTGSYHHADPAAQDDALEYGIALEQQDGYIACLPTEQAATVGYVFYPGGKVEAEAYLPYLAEVARAGYFCAVVQPPFRLAIFDMDAAKDVMARHPEITAWAVGGHSLGGVAAAGFAADEPRVTGLVLLAAYPSADLSSRDIAVVSVTGTNDRVLNWDKYEAAMGKLPPGAVGVSLAGGNHSQFGLYGHQKGDGEATLSPLEQRTLTAKATTELLAGL